MSDRRNVALLGCGGWGKRLARNLAELGALAVVVDPSPDAAALAADLGVPCVTDRAAVFADPNIAAAAIATPAESHAALCLEAIAAGKHVYVEKPIALTTADAKAVAVAADAANRVLMVGHLLQYHPAFVAVRELVKRGGIGGLQHIISNRFSLGVIRDEEDVMWSFSPHDLSMLLSLADTPAKRVRATGASFWQSGISDAVTMHIEFGSGMIAEIRSNWASPIKEQKLTLVGAKAMLVFDDTQPWEQKVKLLGYAIEPGAVRPRAVRGAESFLPLDQGEPLRAEMQHFLECIDTGKRPYTDADEAMGVLSLLEAGKTSLEQDGAWINV